MDIEGEVIIGATFRKIEGAHGPYMICILRYTTCTPKIDGPYDPYLNFIPEVMNSTLHVGAVVRRLHRKRGKFANGKKCVLKCLFLEGNMTKSKLPEEMCLFEGKKPLRRSPEKERSFHIYSGLFLAHSAPESI